MGTLYIPTGSIKSGRILGPVGGVGQEVIFDTPFTSDLKGTSGDYHLDVRAFDADDEPLQVGYRITEKSVSGFTIVADFTCAYITWEAAPYTQ